MAWSPIKTFVDGLVADGRRAERLPFERQHRLAQERRLVDGRARCQRRLAHGGAGAVTAHARFETRWQAVNATRRREWSETMTGSQICETTLSVSDDPNVAGQLVYAA